MLRYDRDKRLLLSVFTLAPFGILPSPAAAQSGTALPPITQPAERPRRHTLPAPAPCATKRVRDGDQAYGAVAVRNVGEGKNYVVRETDPTAHSELLAVRDAARRLGTRDLSDCEVYSTATPCAMCQGALYWARVRRVFTESTLGQGIVPKLGC